jgi:hypothetical protein
MSHQCPTLTGQSVAIDGKSARGSHQASAGMVDTTGCQREIVQTTAVRGADDIIAVTALGSPPAIAGPSFRGSPRRWFHLIYRRIVGFRTE